jgi:hypothetical protein
MAYRDKFSESVEIDLDTVAVELAVKIVMQEGELRFRDKLIDFLNKEVAEARENLPDTSLNWEDGVNYVIHLLKEIDLRDPE